MYTYKNQENISDQTLLTELCQILAQIQQLRQQFSAEGIRLIEDTLFEAETIHWDELEEFHLVLAELLPQI